MSTGLELTWKNLVGCLGSNGPPEAAFQSISGHLREREKEEGIDRREKNV